MLIIYATQIGKTSTDHVTHLSLEERIEDSTLARQYTKRGLKIIKKDRQFGSIWTLIICSRDMFKENLRKMNTIPTNDTKRGGSNCKRKTFSVEQGNCPCNHWEKLIIHLKNIWVPLMKKRYRMIYIRHGPNIQMSHRWRLWWLFQNHQ